VESLLMDERSDSRSPQEYDFTAANDIEEKEKINPTEIPINLTLMRPRKDHP